jgi:hypothetical protein
MFRFILFTLFLNLHFFCISQNHEIIKTSHDFIPKSSLKLSNGNIIVTGFATNISNHYKNYNHIGFLIDSNGHYLNSNPLPYASLNLFENKNALYNMYTTETICVDCGMYIGDVFQSEYDLSLVQQISGFNNSFVGYSFHSNNLNGFAHTSFSNIIYQDTSIFLVNLSTNNVTNYIFNENEISESFRFDDNKVIYKTLNQEVYIGDTLTNFTDTLDIGSGIIPIKISNHYIVNYGNQFLLKDFNGNTIANFSSVNVKDIQFFNNQFIVLRALNGNSYEIEIRDANFTLLQSIPITSPNNIHYSYIVPYTNHSVLVAKENTLFSNNLYTEKVIYNNYNPVIPVIDIAIDEIILLDIHLVKDSLQSGPTEYSYIDSEVLTIAAIITNNSNSQVLISAYVNAEVNYSHGLDFNCPAYSSNFRYITEGLAPGNSDTVYFNPIKLRYSGYNQQRDFCVWLDSPNYSTESNFTNNYLCSNYIFSSIDKLNNESFSIFPNPSSDIINVSINKNSINCTYKIMSLDGKIISQDILIGNEINISNLPSGIYLVHLFDQKESLGIQKIVKL